MEEEFEKKRKWPYFVLAVFILLIAGAGYYWWPQISDKFFAPEQKSESILNNNQNLAVSKPCAKQGEKVNPTPGQDPSSTDECCVGLMPLGVYAQDSKTQECKLALNQPYVCGVCGDGTCQQWEDDCNCAIDCGSSGIDTSKWISYRSEELGIRFKFPPEWSSIYLGNQQNPEYDYISAGKYNITISCKPAGNSLELGFNTQSYFPILTFVTGQYKTCVSDMARPLALFGEDNFKEHRFSCQDLQKNNASRASMFRCDDILIGGQKTVAYYVYDEYSNVLRPYLIYPLVLPRHTGFGTLFISLNLEEFNSMSSSEFNQMAKEKGIDLTEANKEYDEFAAQIYKDNKVQEEENKQKIINNDYSEDLWKTVNMLQIFLSSITFLDKDTDGDGFYDNEESQFGTDINNTDIDGDGLTDNEEKLLDTDPTSADTDNDGLSDYKEVKVYKTSPLWVDTDGDGYSDGEEVEKGFDPIVNYFINQQKAAGVRL